MKSLLVAAAALVGAACLAPAPARADRVVVDVGSGYHHHWWRHHRGWNAYGRGHCRITVVRRWHHGKRVTVRRRVCY